MPDVELRLSARQSPVDGGMTGKPFRGTAEFPTLPSAPRSGHTRSGLKDRSRSGASGELFYRA
jgi:hypothetical protein